MPGLVNRMMDEVLDNANRMRDEVLDNANMNKLDKIISNKLYTY